MEEEYVGYVVVSVPSSPLTKEENTATGVSIEKISLQCFICNVYSRRLAWERWLGAGKDEVGKVDHVPGVSFCKVRRDWNNGRIKYYLLFWEERKEISNILGNIMTPTAHAHVFYPDLQLDLWYNEHFWR